MLFPSRYVLAINIESFLQVYNINSKSFWNQSRSNSFCFSIMILITGLFATILDKELLLYN